MHIILTYTYWSKRGNFKQPYVVFFYPDECAGNPCVNGGCTDNVASYTCLCNPGYTGTNCNINIGTSLIISIFTLNIYVYSLTYHNLYVARLGYVRLFWPRPRGLYLAPFPEECLGTPNIRVQPVSVSTLKTKYPPPYYPPHMKL